MKTITFTLEYPNMILNPNRKAHYHAKAKAARKARLDSKVIALSAGAANLPKDGLQVVVIFHPNDLRKRDDDNVITAFKAYRDGIADALGVDDSIIEFDYTLMKEKKIGGLTAVMISGGGNVCIKCGKEKD